MALSVEQAIRNLSNEKLDRNAVKSNEKVILNKLREATKKDIFYTLPIKKICSILQQKDLVEEVSDKPEIIYNIIDKVTEKYPEESGLLLNVFQTEDWPLSLKECMEMMRHFTSCSLCIKIAELQEGEDNMIEIDWDYKIQEKDKEIEKLKAELAKKVSAPIKEEKQVEQHQVQRAAPSLAPLDKNPPPGLVPYSGPTDLHAAIRGGKLNDVRYYIEVNGVDKNTKSVGVRGGLTPLETAVISGNMPIVRYFVENQHIDISSDLGTNCTKLARIHGRYDIAKYLKSHGAP